MSTLPARFLAALIPARRITLQAEKRNSSVTLNALALCFVSAAVVTCGFTSVADAQTQPAVHPFVQPPVLVETEPASTPVLQLLRLPKLAATQGCQPEGSIRRDGNDVYVKLNLVRGKFTINNPDPDDPYGGEDPVELRSYGGCPSGPTVELLSGNAVHFDLINDLPVDDPTCRPRPPAGLQLPAGVGCFNSTNLHTHGLHVSPAGNGDNVLLDIVPHTDFPYEINIPSDHPAGTFWYHSHRHGATATQVASGATGVLIVRGTRPYQAPTADEPHPIADVDTILHDAQGTPVPEQLFLFQQIPYACFSNPPNPPLGGSDWLNIFTKKGLYNSASSTAPDGPKFAKWICPKPDGTNFATPGAVENFTLQIFSGQIWDTSGRFTTVNGVVEPTLTVKAGELQRWRFVHGGIHDTINVQIVRASGPANGANLIDTSALVGDRPEQSAKVQTLCVANASTLIPQFEIADDGLTRRHIEKIAAGADAGSNYLQPGYRSDILVAFPEDGDYCLLNQAAPVSQRVDPGTDSGGGSGPGIPQLLAYIHVRGGKAIEGDLQEYVQNFLYTNNPQLPAPVRDALRTGDLSPWAPFLELAPPTPGHVQAARFDINFPHFLVNDASYNPSVVNITRQVNTTDDWILTSVGSPHIYHIHVNPFEIMDVTHEGPGGQQVSIFDENGHCKAGGEPDPQGLANQYCTMWHTFRDTVFVENGYEVHTRTHYDRYIGEFVIHCHILDHEDAGMMLNIQIVPNLAAPDHGLGMGNMEHPH
jgi:FtsP/CotA-like multicopper oxidase with cupredoxin domain